MENLKKLAGENIFFIGIGGISMSALVIFSCSLGAKVSGSDANINDEVRKLNKFGITTFLGHDEKNITPDISLVVFSGAISEDNPERIKAKKLGIKLMERSQFLGHLSSLYACPIVVAGTHGKTTTTAMFGEMLLLSDLRPSIHLGGEDIRFGNFVVGDKEIFLTEGCEYRNSIKYLKPAITLITNIELDHTDCYENIQQLESAFLNLANNTEKTVLVFENIPFSEKISAKNEVINVGFGENYDICGKNLTLEKDGTYSFEVFFNGYVGKFRTNLLGLHNAKNALCALALALVKEISCDIVYSALRNFSGVKRRLEKLNDHCIADYAHHPSEIEASIDCVLSGFRSVTVLFQPHTFSRTIGLKSEFLKAFQRVDKLIIFKTYPAREKYIVGGSAKELFNQIKHKNKFYVDTLAGIKNHLKNDTSDIFLVLGAGDIYEISKKAIRQL